MQGASGRLRPVQSRFARFYPVLIAAAAWMAVATATRALLALRPDLGALGAAADWARVFGYGLAFDFLAAVYVLAPAVLWLALIPHRLARSVPHRALALAAFCALVFACLVLAVSEWLFWDEFGGRFNFIAVDYLLYTHEVLQNIWESYPIGKALLGLAALAFAVGFFLRRRLWHAPAARLAWRSALGVLLAWGLGVAATLRWVD